MTRQPVLTIVFRHAWLLATVLWALTAWSAPAGAQPQVIVAGLEEIDLNGRFEHRVDPEGGLSAGALIASDGETWDRTGRQAFGYTGDTHWFRLRLTRQAGADQDWILELGRPYVDDLRVYVDDGQSMREHRLGDHVPVAARPVATRLFAVPLPLSADHVTTVLIRTQSTSATALTATLVRPLAFMAQQSRDALLYGAFYGICVVIILFHLTIGSWIGDRIHLVYAAFIACQLTSYLFINGYGQVLAWQSWPHLSDRAINIANFAGSFFGVWLWIEILTMKRCYPRFYRVFQGLAALFLICLATGWGQLYPVVAPRAFLLVVFMTFVALALSVDLLRRRPRHLTLWFYSSAFAVSSLALFVHVSSLFGLIPLYWLPENLFQTSSVIHVTLLSIGLIYRVRKLNQERTQAREEAISASARADGQRSLVAMLSHEFRSPLASISSAAQMVSFREAEIASDSSQRLTRIDETARRLAALIDVFLAGDAIDRGKIVLSPRRGDVLALVEGALAQFGPQSSRIQVSCPSLALDADHDLMGVALRNCLANALTYSPPHSPVRLHVESDGPMVRFRVTDQGPGIATDEMEMLGTPYFRGSQATHKVGSGLGLSMVRTIMQAHGGALDIESTSGSGTTVVLSLKATLQ